MLAGKNPERMSWDGFGLVDVFPVMCHELWKQEADV